MKTKPLFLLDENVAEKESSEKFVSACELVKMGTSDHILLDKVIERNLTIITRDIRFILYAIQKDVNIVYQDYECQRFYIYGSKTEKMKDRGTYAKYTGGASQKYAKIIAQHTSSNISLNGFSSVFSF